MKVLVVGSTNQLARPLVDVGAGIGVDVLPIPSKEIDVAGLSVDQLCARIEDLAPDVIVNTAALSGVDDCERDPDLAYAINSHGARNVAEAAERVGAFCIYVSTDYVFDGRSAHGYRPDAAANPLNVYGASKRLGETFTLQFEGAVARVSWLVGERFVRFIQGRIAEGSWALTSAESVSTPTLAYDAAEELITIALERRDGDIIGIRHIANRPACTRIKLCRALVEHLGGDGRIISKMGNVGAPRPTFSPLLPAVGVDVRDWRKTLDQNLARLR